ncbi:MAG TPA: enoyl-CoA hydratase/isomerase family protein [Acidimicrobiales bacterium]|nr:enoyl-CoA hydratase/isomerase family protein [Acidimicrobiales bacterium]
MADASGAHAGLTTTRHGAILVLTLDRPAKKNALTSDMYRGLVDGLDALEADDQLRVAVLAGAGSDFCAGNDLFDFLQPQNDTGGARFLPALFGTTKPLVAAVQGRAVGVGATMLLHCDFVYLSPDAQIRFPFVDLGLVPEAGSTLLLPELVGARRAADLLLRCAPLDAASAVEYGIANEVVDADVLLDRAMETAAALAAKPAAALRATRALLRPDADRLAARSRAELSEFSSLLRSPEFVAAVEGFASRKRA